jgi:hypothetical protein
MEQAETRTSPSDADESQDLKGRGLHRHLLDTGLEANRLQSARPLIFLASQGLSMKIMMEVRKDRLQGLQTLRGIHFQEAQRRP